MPAVLRDYRPVTAERLKNPEDDNWLMIRRTYDGWGFSPLIEITPANVARLRPAWVFSTGEARVHQAAPLVNSGVMFVTSPNNQVIAIDVKTGNLLWRYRRPRTPAMSCRTKPTAASRSTATRCTSPPAKRCSSRSTHAPAAKCGRQSWRTTRLATTRRWRRSWPAVWSWSVRRAASSAFAASSAASISRPARSAGAPTPCPRPASRQRDVAERRSLEDRRRTRVGHRQLRSRDEPRLLGHGQRRADDRRSTSRRQPLCHVDGRDRRRHRRDQGYHQYHPNDSWDWDEVSPPILVDYRRNGRTIKGLIDVARDGYIWFLERSSGPITFVEGKPFVFRTSFASLDPVTGRPDVDPERKPMTGKRADFCPGVHGGKNWPPIAFSPHTRMIYIPANNNLCGSNMGTQPTVHAGASVRRRRWQSVRSSGRVPITSARCRRGTWTPGRRSGRTTTRGRRTGAACSRPRAALVFTGGTSDRKFHAFDAATGKLLWEFPMNSGASRRRRLSRLTGKQYVAVETGWGGDSRGMQATLNNLFPGEYPEVPEGGAVWVFALE